MGRRRYVCGGRGKWTAGGSRSHARGRQSTIMRRVKRVFAVFAVDHGRAESGNRLRRHADFLEAVQSSVALKPEMD